MSNDPKISDIRRATPRPETRAEEQPRELEGLIHQVLLRLGEDPERPGLLRTPARIANALSFLTSGYQQTVEDVVEGAVFPDDCDEMVVVKDVEFYSQCEHHMLPFFGRVHVGYIPDGKIIGLSKIARVVDVFARRLQVQERMTAQIASFLQEVLNPKGVAVVVEGAHMCAMMRGVKKSQVNMTTRTMLGVFKDDPQERAEFLSLISKAP